MKMRELKFRAWDKRLSKYRDVEAVFLDGSILAIMPPCNDRERIKSEDVIVEQYTGLKDKNGKEIYEGDIVKIYIGRRLDSVLLIQFDELNGDYVWCKNEDVDSSEYGGFSYWAKYLVVGNIHENPELLEGE